MDGSAKEHILDILTYFFASPICISPPSKKRDISMVLLLFCIFMKRVFVSFAAIILTHDVFVGQGILSFL
ncbi:hypothetical protein O7W_00699 [Bartonella quintana JK 56]|nr:hypothetical protein Q651_01274 [Bartonella quintana BQ2-D70]ETS18240.1 hypothetical protein Q647_01189 [Bartonella quintana JK 7]KEC61413.1 hypothetical protein O7Y_01181 [Bartonella quintana JK 63]KEC64656.1 hypothetical protein O7W_00699 [Bartonella quintana JK 56]KEC66736.1 hypothetical protein O7S_00752 [Bartonella quintana JK 67]